MLTVGCENSSLLFVSLGAVGVVPLIHAHLSTDLFDAEYPATTFAFGAILLVLGAMFYLSRTPEKYWPGQFDIWVSISLDRTTLMQADEVDREQATRYFISWSAAAKRYIYGA